METCSVLLLQLVILGVVVYLLTRQGARLRRAERRLETLERGARSRPGTPDAAASAAAGDRGPAEPPPGAAPPVPPGRPPAPPAEPGPPPTATPPQTRPTAGQAPPAAPAEPAKPSPVDRPPAPARPAIDWERWIGVRGAALVGGVVLALAGILLVKFAIDRGLISPALRVSLGLVAGVACLLGSERLHRRRYAAADPLAGAGVVILYAAVWAAAVLYQLLGLAPGFVLMALITAVCGLIAWRRRSPLVSALGLLGGFATPLLVSATAGPLDLFGYLLLLNGGVLWVARRHGWPLLAALGLAATALYQVHWIVTETAPGDLGPALVILAAFGALFAVPTAWREPPGRRDLWRLQQWGGVVFTFAMTVHLAWRADLGVHLWPLAILLGGLSLGAALLDRLDERPSLGAVAAAADLAVVVTWLARSAVTPALAWELVAVAVGLALVFQLAGEVRPGPPSAAALVASLGFLGLLVVAPAGAPAAPFWPFFAGWMALAAILLRQGGIGPTAWPLAIAALGPAVGFLLWLGQRDLRPPDGPQVEGLLALALALGVALQLGALAIRRPERRLAGDLAAAGYAGLMLLSVVVTDLRSAPADGLAAPLFHGATLVCALLAIVVASRRGWGRLYAAAVAALAAGHLVWSVGSVAADATTGLAAQAATVALLTGWPILASTPLRGRTAAMMAAAAAAPLWFPSLLALFHDAFGDGAIGLLPLALGATALGGLTAARRVLPTASAARRTAVVWLAASALGFAALTVPLQLDREWITVGWAVQAAATALLWRRLDHPGLKYFAAALFAAVTARLLFNPALLDYHGATARPFFNWLAYTYLVPVAALLLAGRWLGGLEVARLRPWERHSLYQPPRPLVASACGLTAIVLSFAWLNLSILDAFAPGRSLGQALTLSRLPARDLTLSLAWALFAVALLALGMRRRSVVLRWISLGFLVLTIGKVFLYDLGELRDLYRVASLTGLALSLLGVSLAYQRFVFGRDEEEP